MRSAARASPARRGSWLSTSSRSGWRQPDNSAQPTSSIPPKPIRSEAVRALLPRGADHVFDFVGLKAVAEQGLAMLGAGGGLYLVGVAKPEVGLDVNIFDAIGGQKRVQGVNYGSTNFKSDIPMYAELYLQGRLNLDDLVSKRIALRDVNDGYAALKDGSINRVVVTSF